MYCVTDIGEVVTYPMIKFDLSGHAGQVLTGAAVFKAFLFSGFSQAASRTVQIGAIRQSWDPATVTYDSFDILSGNVDWLNSESIVWYDSRGTGDPRYVSWTLPQAVVQGWIDDPREQSRSGAVEQCSSHLGVRFGLRVTGELHLGLPGIA